MNDLFLNEWRVYRAGLKRPLFAGEVPRGEAEFDAGVKAGQVRIFADTNRPFVALILEDNGLLGRRLVPVSPFSAPASARETQVGARVFQCWNACQGSRQFTDRSWLVDALSDADLEVVRRAVAAAHPGRVLAGDGVQARYEREFLVAGGNFIPFVRKRQEQRFVFSRWLYSGWGVAASIAVFFGAFVVLSASDRDAAGRHCWKNPFTFTYQASVESVPPMDGSWETVELIEADSVQDEGSAIAEAVRPQFMVPGFPRPYRDDGVRRQGVLAPHERSVRTPAIGLDEGFVSPAANPTDYLVASIRPEAVRAAEFTYASASLPTVQAAGEVRCLVTECPWNSSRRLLNVTAKDAKGLRIEVRFNRQVFGYRLLSEVPGESVNAFYEIVPQPLSAFVPAEAIEVTTSWRDAAGEQSRVERINLAEPRDLRGLPELPRRSPDATGASASDDVKIDVNFPTR